MKRGYLFAAFVLGIGAFACERRNEAVPGETTTTSGDIESDRAGATGGGGGLPAVRGGGTTGAETTDEATPGPNRTGQTTDDVGDPGTLGTADEPRDPRTGAGMMGGRDGGAAVTGGRDGGVTWQSGPPMQDLKEPIGGGEPKAKSGAGTKNNTSTTLGDGTSGQYTGGKGTYGGKATHGTGEEGAEKVDEKQK